MNITEFRKQYPQYNDLSDEELTKSLHKKYYPDMDYGKFTQEFMGTSGFTKSPLLGLIPDKQYFEEYAKPQLESIGKEVTQQLPTMFMIGGGAMGAATSGPPGGIIGAGLGTGIGKAAQEGIESLMGWQQPEDISKTTPEIYYDIGKDMVYGSTAEMGGGIVGEGIRGVGMFGKTLGKKVEPLLVKGAEKIPPGSWFFKKWRGRLNDQIIKANKQYATEVLGLPSPGLRVSVEAEKRELFDKLPELAGGKEAMVDAPNILKYINENMDAFNFVKRRGAQKALISIRKEMTQTGGKISFGKLNNLSSNVWGGFRKMTPAEQRLMGGLREAIKNDMYNIGEEVGNTYVQAMDKAGLTHRMFETQYIENMFKRSMDWNPDKGVYVFAPAKFRNIVDNSMPKLQSMFKKDPEIPQMINKYADSLMEFSYDLAQLSATKPPGFLEVGATGAAWLGAAKTGLLVPYGFETAMAHSLAHPRGWMKQWFKGTLKMPVTKEAVKMGTKGVGLNIMENQSQ